MSFQDAVFPTPDGAEIHYKIRPGRDPLVLLHAMGCDASMWDGVVAALPSDRGIVIPEVRGHGASTLGWRAPSVDLWADDVVRLLQLKRVERPAFAGLSMGGYVALAIAAAHPGFARAYAFVSTTAAPDDDAARLQRARGIAMIRLQGWRSFAEAMVPSLLNDNREQFESRREHLMAMFERAGDAGLPPTLMGLAARPDRRSMLLSIGVKSILIVGAVDALTPPDRSRAMAAAIPGARLHVLEDVAHLSALESPQKIAALLGPL
ncbi:MAG TPA: alpha/beta fold hydrolase [Candidatus Polarisedimenticolaceae bacterium]|nr:alpha/beta fold hydrolase [Candidatus Polarisedimenticolaceae bacterium]